MYENDPDRLNQPRVGDPVRDPVVEGGGMPSFLTVALLAAAVLALGLMFWPRDQNPSVTQNAPRIERPAPTPPTIPPANKPVSPPNTPAPQQ